MTAGIAVAAAVFALNQVQEARRTRERQAQPNVVAFADLNPVNWRWLDVVVKNFGQTAAYHVRLHFEPWPTVLSTWTHPLTGDTVTQLLVPKPDIPVLAPGQEWRTLWDRGENRADAEFAREAVLNAMEAEAVSDAFRATAPEDLGWRFEGHVVFEDKAGRRYCNPTVLDIHVFYDMRRVQPREDSS